MANEVAKSFDDLPVVETDDDLPVVEPENNDLRSGGTIKPFFPEDEQVIRPISRDDITPTGESGGFVDLGQQFLAGFEDIVGPEDDQAGIDSLFPFQDDPFGFAQLRERAQGGEQGVSQPEDSRLIEFTDEGLFEDFRAAKREPRGVFERGARFAGQTAAVAPIFGAASRFIPPVAAGVGKLDKALRFLPRVLHEAGQTFKRVPVKVIAAETGFGAVAGAGGAIAEKVVPDSDAATFVGEILAPIIVSFAPAGLAVTALRKVQGLFRTIKEPFTAPGSTARVKARAERSATLGQRKEALTELDKPTTLDPETGEPVLSPATRTGVPGLLSIQKAVRDSSEELLREGDIQIARANEVIEQSLKGADVPVEVANVPIMEAQHELDELLDTSVRIAAQRTDERIAELGPTVSSETANIIGKEELTKAMKAGRVQREEFFNLVPENTAVPFSEAQKSFNEFVTKFGGPEQRNIPKIAIEFLSEESPDFFAKNQPQGFLENQTRIKDLRGLQSELRQLARNDRAGKKKRPKRALIADGIANAINDDLELAAAGPEATEAIKIAVAFSKDFAERFNQGTVGKLLGREIAGDPSVPAGLTFESTIGFRGARAREALDDIFKAFDSPEAPGSEIIISAADDFQRSRFFKAAVEDGELNVRAAKRFIKNNDEILKRMPDLNRQINEAIEVGNTLALKKRRRAGIDLNDPKVSKATMLIKKGPVETFRQISKLAPVEAANETKKLINLVSRDTTGEALGGLKSGYIEFLLSGAKETSRDIKGNLFVSGFALRDALNERGISAISKKLFSDDELARLKIVTEDFIRLEKQLQAKLPAEGVIGDKPSKVAEVVAGVAGAGFGRIQSKRIGLGGTVQIPGIFAQRFREMVAAGVADPATRLIRDSIQDEQLFRELLQAGIVDGTKLTKVAEKRLNAWVTVVLAEHGGAFEKEEETE